MLYHKAFIETESNKLDIKIFHTKGVYKTASLRLSTAP